MDARAILDGLLDKSQQATNTGIRMAEERSIIPPAGDERTAMLKGLGTGALAAGAVALLFGSKGTRKFAKKAVKLGGTAAIGGLAYKAFTQWQAAQQQGAVNAGATGRATQIMPGSTSGKMLDLDQFEPGTPIADLTDVQATVRSEAIVQAMISAARADGHVDDAEMAMIEQQINSLGLEKDISAFLLAELNKPVDVNSIAALADTPETAAELYLASALVVDIDSPSERIYLDHLATALNLDAQMVAHLEEPLLG
ncbi:MAG: tellurite resistance TerB family protein [Granulosicoccus sp.]